MSLLQSIIYGLVSGLSELMPVSSAAHQVFLRELFGVQKDPVIAYPVIGYLLFVEECFLLFCI